MFDLGERGAEAHRLNWDPPIATMCDVMPRLREADLPGEHRGVGSALPAAP